MLWFAQGSRVIFWILSVKVTQVDLFVKISIFKEMFLSAKGRLPGLFIYLFTVLCYKKVSLNFVQTVQWLRIFFFAVAIWPVFKPVKIFKTWNNRQSGIFNKFDLSKNPNQPNHHMSVKKRQAILKCFIDLKNSVWFTLRKTKPCFVTHNFFRSTAGQRSRFLKH